VAHEQLARLLFQQDVSALGPAAAKALGLTVLCATWPVLDVSIADAAPVRLRFNCEHWNDLAPSITLLNPDGAPFTGKVPGHQFHPGPHPATGLPFVCMAGSHEYHTHPNHLSDAWDNHRGKDGMNLVGILMQLARAWRKVANL
jgi:hypothetical protein